MLVDGNPFEEIANVADEIQNSLLIVDERLEL